MIEEIKLQSPYCQALNDFMSDFDINSVPKKEREWMFVSYTQEYLDSVSVEDDSEEEIHVEDVLNEGLASELAKRVRPVREVIELLTEMFERMKDIQFRTVSNNGIQSIKMENIPVFWIQPVGVYIPDSEMNLHIIDEKMTEFGYVRVRYQKKFDQNRNPWYFVIYNPNPKFMKDVRNNIDAFGFYHLSPEFNHDSIMEDGLKTSRGGRTYTYPDERVFFYVMYKKHEYTPAFVRMMTAISKNIKKKEPYFSGIFNVYKLNVDMLPADVKMFWDPNAQDCVYFNVPIPADALTWTKETKIFE